MEDSGRHGDWLDSLGGLKMSRAVLGRAMLKMTLKVQGKDAVVDDVQVATAFVKELRNIIEHSGLSCEGLSERAELQQRAREALTLPHALPNPGVTTVEHNGHTAHILTPAQLRRGHPLPLLIVLHGASKTDQVISEMVGAHTTTANRHNALVLVPEALDHTWDLVTTGQREDVDFIVFAIDTVREKYCVDEQRIGIMGFSDGASYGLSLALNNPDIFQAAMVWAAGFYLHEPTLMPSGMQKPPLFIEYGTKDELFDYNSIAVPTRDRLKEAGYRVEFHTTENGHTASRDFVVDAMTFWESLPPLSRQQPVADSPQLPGAPSDRAPQLSAAPSPAVGETGAPSRRPLPVLPLTAEAAIDWITGSADEFEALLLPLELVEDTVKIRTQYKQLSLLVHPDKCSHPEANTAFRKLFGAMQVLLDPMQQRLALRKARRKATGKDSATLDEEKWWEKSTVDEMEQSFREMEQRYQSLGVFEFEKKKAKKQFGVDEEQLWISVEDANALLINDLVIFLDSRDTKDFDVSHVAGSYSMPGHTLQQLRNLDQTAAFELAVQNPEQSIIVYSDNGSRLSRCTNVANELRKKLKPERVLRLTGGLNQWKRHGFPVEGDPRALFNGRVLGDSVKRLGT
eukprot:gnl/TRDRNA2_/TRDRNA2_206516_c0_seq1.p1 gnl/TRDRNA2_/TRDRNA2_206516_c0~~gnl/TRDRNA2_/TRDRNA2_206516_c0_seq1.p1  ORF type:complete len:627 (+),score=96.58 gnl/TRDRNA2_/TRDRNA2_206516_c0_seq1:2-1882(+)